MTPHETGRVRNHGHIKRSSRHVATKPLERICAHVGCLTQLSVYNHSDYCALHEQAQKQQHRSSKIGLLLTRTCANPGCAHVFETTNERRMYCSARCRAAAYHGRQADQLTVA